LPRPRPKSAAADTSAGKPDVAKPEMATPQVVPAHEAAKDEKPAATSTMVPAPAAPPPADELNE
jgi:hypothetical protein